MNYSIAQLKYNPLRNNRFRLGITTSLLVLATLGIGQALGQMIVPSAAEALNCKKGKPCGKVCIPQNSVCQLNGGTNTSSSTTGVFGATPKPSASPAPAYIPSVCNSIPAQAPVAPVGASFTDKNGRVVVIRAREQSTSGVIKVTLAYQGNNNEFLHLKYNPKDWSKYLSGQSNQAKYRISGEVKPTKWREQVEKDCSGRSSYTASLIRQLGY
ncbi:MAG: hypothetical protein WCO45_15105 [Pseudanabaena sp. ELA607]